MFKWLNKILRSKKVAEFSTIGSNDNIPFASGHTDEVALGLTNPDSVLTGTNRGEQALGAQNIKTDSANQRIVVNDNITNRVSFGRIGNGVNDWGLKVSRQNISVDTATDAQLIFNSNQNVFKVIKSGTITLPLNITIGGSNSVSVDHGLTYPPTVLAFTQDFSGLSQQLPFVVVNSFASGATLQGRVAWQISWYADSQKVYFLYEGYTQGTGSSLPIKYYIFTESSAPS